MTVARKFREGARSFKSLPIEDNKWVIKDLEIQFPKSALGKSKQFSDEVLLRIAEALERTIDKPHVFLSHSSKDKKFVRALAHRLRKDGIRVWLDEAEIKVGESLIAKLQSALETVDFLVVVLSQASIKSPWVQREVEIAMNYEIKERRVRVLPIMKETVPLPSFLEGKLYLDFTTKRASEVSR